MCVCVGVGEGDKHLDLIIVSEINTPIQNYVHFVCKQLYHNRSNYS